MSRNHIISVEETGELLNTPIWVRSYISNGEKKIDIEIKQSTYVVLYHLWVRTGYGESWQEEGVFFTLERAIEEYNKF